MEHVVSKSMRIKVVVRVFSDKFSGLQLTGVNRAGVEMGDVTVELNLIPDPKSKSQSLTGTSWSG